MHSIPPPDVRDLLLPLLACLPTAFLSTRPPPALLPLLSPILRQRVHIRTSAAPPPSSRLTSSNWLGLLTWSPSRAARLNEIVGDLHLEPHPVSGELELFGDEEDEDAGRVWYRRLDSETLQARCEVREHGLAVVWLWCENDTGGVGLPSEALSGEAENGWKVAEVQPVESDEEEQAENTRDELRWRDTIAEADAASLKANIETPSLSRSSPRPNHLSTEPSLTSKSTSVAPPAQPEDDDDYWASYDRTPNRTPMTKRSPAPHTPRPEVASRQSTANTTTTTSAEDDYYARYGSVQPALDAHDPDEEEGAEDLESSLHQRQDLRREYNNPSKTLHQSIPSPPHSDEEEPTAATSAPTAPLRIHSPTPSRPSSRGSGSGGRRSPVAALESSAEMTSAAEVGVKQHISTEMKSLFRLARAAGIDKSEFERVVRTELDVLGMMDI